MATEARALLVYEVVTLRQKVTNETAFNQGKASIKLLARLGTDATCENDAVSSFGVFQMLHKAQIVQLTLHTATNAGSLTNIERFKLLSPPTPEDIDTGDTRKFV